MQKDMIVDNNLLIIIMFISQQVYILNITELGKLVVNIQKSH